MFQLIGFLGVIRRLILVFAAEIALFGKSNVSELNVFVVEAENTVLPIIYVLLPSLPVIVILSLKGAKDAGFRTLFKVIVLELLLDVGYKLEKTTNSTWKDDNKFIVHCPEQTEVELAVPKLDLENGPQVSNCN